MMSDPSIHTSEDMENGSSISAMKNGNADIQYTTINPEYSRYLDLHARFEGSGRRKLLRKRESFSDVDLVNLSKANL